MKKWQGKMPLFILFIQEMLLVYIILFPFLHEKNHVSSIIYYVFFIIISGVIYGFFMLKTKKLAITSFFIPIVIGLGILFNFSPSVSITIAIVLFWRIKDFIYCREIYLTNYHLFFITTGIVLFFYLFQFKDRESLLIFLVIQLIMTLLQNVTQFFVSESFATKDKVHYFFTFLIFIVSLLLIAIVSRFALPFVKKLVAYFLQFIAYLFGLLATPLLIILEKLIQLKDVTIDMDMEGQFDEENIIPVDRIDITFYNIVEYIIMFSVGVIFLVLLYVAWKKLTETFKKKENPTLDTEIEWMNETKIVSSTKKRWKTIFTPKNEVRKLFIKLEKNLSKSGFSRKKGETIEEWLSTIPIDNSLKDCIIITYSKVRYGNLTIDREETESYRKAIKEAWNEAERVKRNH